MRHENRWRATQFDCNGRRVAPEVLLVAWGERYLFRRRMFRPSLCVKRASSSSSQFFGLNRNFCGDSTQPCWGIIHAFFPLALSYSIDR